MDDLNQQKAQIDQEAQAAKQEADRIALEQRQALADQEAERIRSEAEEKAKQVENDAQK